MSRKGLMEQDLSKLDVTQLHPLSPEVISRQATINIGKIYCLHRNSLRLDAPDLLVGRTYSLQNFLSLL
ncbi:hypothetical protein BHE74_00008349 [Ensete ventricosum]|nr:hypothetical protein GW17_00013794 [Ensete ventricosum]RWW83145.1 hypothetical protein BHE74_00008349 [Ensete ventricosum]RZR87176.1 hypothetical protein BHM03_00014531 [Ensete ventricosum]